VESEKSLRPLSLSTTTNHTKPHPTSFYPPCPPIHLPSPKSRRTAAAAEEKKDDSAAPEATNEAAAENGEDDMFADLKKK
jgi:hypothetical protein